MNHSYALITPARNEESNIERTIQSVLSQTILPQKWIIINDSSTDRTDEIIEQYHSKTPFIDHVKRRSKGTRNFGSKAQAFEIGYRKLINKNYHFIGNLDADISFEKDYFENLLNEFDQNSELGIAGGLVFELYHKKFISQNISLNSVAGSVQMFRSQCLRQIGSYLPLQNGGEDAVAEILARMNGWEVQTFPNLKVQHHGKVGMKTGFSWHNKIREGQRFYLLGYHPLFYLIRSFYRLIDRPFIIGSVLQLVGFFSAYFKRSERPVPQEVITYVRSEQNARLKWFLKRKEAKEFIHTTRTQNYSES